MLSTINFNAFEKATGLFQKVEFKHKNTFFKEAPLIYKVVATTSAALILLKISYSIRYTSRAENSRYLLQKIPFLKKAVLCILSSLPTLLSLAIATNSNAPVYNNKSHYIARDVAMLAGLFFSLAAYLKK
jgi:hypothetical protein